MQVQNKTNFLYEKPLNTAHNAEDVKHFAFQYKADCFAQRKRSQPRQQRTIMSSTSSICYIEEKKLT
jgi:hypothetical protein